MDHFDVEYPPLYINLRQGKITKFDRFIDPNIRGAQHRVYSDLRIYCNLVLFRLKIHEIGTSQDLIETKFRKQSID